MDVDLVRELLAEQFPQLDLATIAPIAEGEGRAFLVDGTYVFRFATDAQSAQKLVRERSLLSAIAPALPIAVPALEFAGRPAGRSPYPFIGHRRLEGRSGEEARPDRRHWPRIAQQLGEFFSALHATPVETGRGCGLAFEPMQPPDSLLRSSIRHAHAIRSARPILIDDLVERYLTGDIAIPKPSPPGWFACHGDMKGEHIIMSDAADAVTGVIDWSDCCLSDRLLDFTGLVIWLGEAFVRRVLEQYTVPVDAEFVERVLFYARCFALGNLGKRLAEGWDAPLDLLTTQARWAFAK